MFRAGQQPAIGGMNAFRKFHVDDVIGAEAETVASEEILEQDRIVAELTDKFVGDMAGDKNADMHEMP